MSAQSHITDTFRCAPFDHEEAGTRDPQPPSLVIQARSASALTA